jgi:hypothetical protein
MSDIYCKCGEPWDLDCIHEHIAETYDENKWHTKGRHDQDKYEILFKWAMTDFRKKGCELFGTSHSNASPSAGATFSAVQDIMGDDVDGAISMMEDAEDMGLF